MKAQANSEIVFQPAGFKADVRLVLPAVGFVFTECVCIADVALTEAAQQVISSRREHGLGYVGRNALGLDAAKFVPIAVERVVIHRTFETQRITRFRHPFQVGAPVFGIKLVIETGSVTAVRIGIDVRISKAGVGFVGVETCVSDLQFQPLLECGVGLPEELEHRLDQIETGILRTAIDVSVSISALAMQFQQVAEAADFRFLRVAEP